MKTIICYGDSNTWGADPVTASRFAPDKRWTGVMATALGDGYRVIEEGLNGRTTVVDDPLAPHRNGLSYLPACIDSHHPFDLITIMLGTNDLKARLNRTATDIAESAHLLAETVIKTNLGPGGSRPKVLLICPPKVEGVTTLADMFVGAEEKAARMPALFETFAQWTGSGFLDAGAHIRCSPIDGIHFEEAEHAILGNVVAQKVREMLQE